MKAALSQGQSGDTVVLRYFSRGCASGALPTRAVETAEAPVLWLSGGTPVKSPSVAGRFVREVPLEERFTQPREPIDRTWTGEGVLILGRPGRAHSIWLFWDNGRFTGWYVQLEDPWRPFRLGFDTRDHVLDIWIPSDGSWRWKDEQELDVAVDVGAVTPQEAAAFRAEGERVIAEWAFPTGWEDWRADPAWALPSVPEDWNA